MKGYRLRFFYDKRGNGTLQMFNDSVKLPLESSAITGSVGAKNNLKNGIQKGVWTVRLIDDQLRLVTPMQQLSKKQICVIGKGIVVEKLAMIDLIRQAFKKRDEVLLYINVEFPPDIEDVSPPPKKKWWQIF